MVKALQFGASEVTCSRIKGGCIIISPQNTNTASGLMPKRQQGPVPFYKRLASRWQCLVEHVAVSAHWSWLLKHQEPSETSGTNADTTISSHGRPQEPTQRSPPMTAFDIVVVGAGGGPDETNLSAYLVKSHPSCWLDGVVALEAGSGQGALKHILKRNPRLFPVADEEKPGYLSSTEVYNAIRCFLITHGHLDHINSLVVSAGSLTGPRKRLFAAKQTLDDIASVFNDRVWPNLASWIEDDDDFKLLYSPLNYTDSLYTPIRPDISVKAFPLNHGGDAHAPYESTAYFVRHDLTGIEFLFFGDVEPDSLAATPQSIHVWREAATKMITGNPADSDSQTGTLRAVFIECSWPSGRPDAQLYGHLTPEYLLEELVALATEVRRLKPPLHSSDSHTRHTRKRQKRLLSASDIRGALSGLTVYVTHCKDGPNDAKTGTPMREIIVEKVRSLVEAKGLGCTVIAAEQGMHIQI